MELEENMPLLEWLANNYKKFGAGLEIITDRSQVRQLSYRVFFVTVAPLKSIETLFKARTCIWDDRRQRRFT